MVATDSEATALFYSSIDVENVVSSASANINDESAEIFLVLSENDLRGGESGEDDILHVEGQLLHATDGVLDSGPHTMNHMKIGLEFLSQHADRVEDTILSIDMVMLNNGMKKNVLGGD